MFRPMCYILSPMKHDCILAIVGSTSLEGNEEARQKVVEVINDHRPRRIVSGGAKGIDTMAENAADERGIEKSIHHPTVRRWWGDGGFKERNSKIAEEAECLVRISDPASKTYGSGWTADYAESLGKPVERFSVIRS